MDGVILRCVGWAVYAVQKQFPRHGHPGREQRVSEPVPRLAQPSTAGGEITKNCSGYFELSEGPAAEDTSYIQSVHFVSRISHPRCFSPHDSSRDGGRRPFGAWRSLAQLPYAQSDFQLHRRNTCEDKGEKEMAR